MGSDADSDSDSNQDAPHDSDLDGGCDSSEEDIPPKFSPEIYQVRPHQRMLRTRKRKFEDDKLVKASKHGRKRAAIQPRELRRRDMDVDVDVDVESGRKRSTSEVEGDGLSVVERRMFLVDGFLCIEYC